MIFKYKNKNNKNKLNKIGNYNSKSLLIKF